MWPFWGAINLPTPVVLRDVNTEEMCPQLWMEPGMPAGHLGELPLGFHLFTKHSAPPMSQSPGM